MAKGIVVETEQDPVYCAKCHKTIAAKNFYTYKDGSKCELCKSCLTLHVDNTDPETYKWLLEKFDVPYIPEEWNILYERAYLKDPYKITGQTILGKYLAKMRLKRWADKTYADSESIIEERAKKAEKYGTAAQQQKQKIEDMQKQLEEGAITQAQYDTYVAVNNPDYELPQVPTALDGGGPARGASGGRSPYPINNPGFAEVKLPDIGAQLTEEDKINLATKWGVLYTPADWVSLEKMWRDYNKSFDLHNADLINGTKQLCKLELKGNQALDSGDFESYSKIARASDSLRKSLKFTEAQRKEEKSDAFSAYGLIVAFAERNNDEDYIRPIDLSVDRDIVDEDIRDLKKYNQTLVKDDPAVYKMIEQYIKKRTAIEEHDEDIANAEDGIVKLEDDDLKEYTDNLNKQIDIDNGIDGEDD